MHTHAHTHKQTLMNVIEYQVLFSTLVLALRLSMIQISNVKNTKELSNGKNNSCFDSFIFVCALYAFLLCNCVFCRCFQMVSELTCAPSTNIVSMTKAKYIPWLKNILHSNGNNRYSWVINYKQNIRRILSVIHYP